MSKFGLFDSVMLKSLANTLDDELIPTDAPGTVVEIFEKDDICMVEFFGEWVKYNSKGKLVPAHYSDQDAFRETLDVVAVPSEQLTLHAPIIEMMKSRSRLLKALEELPATLITEVADFAESLLEKQRHTAVANVESRRSVVDIIADAPRHRLFDSAQSIDKYIAEERAAWDD